jgi:RND family efflux transporter MFP subunit
MDSEFEVERAEGPETQVAAPPQIDPVPKVPPAKLRTAVLIGAAVLIVLLLAGGVTLFKRAQDEQVLAKETETNSVPTVAVIHPTAEKPDQELVLPGTLQAYEESPIFARTNGYLVRWYKDIGSPIKQGELLAEIDTPEVDQELMQTRAARQQVEAQLQLARTSDERWKSLRQTDSVSQQEADQQSSAYQQSKANLAAADANVRRLEQLESFKKVYAPFSGVLTRRNVDPGALINAGAGGRELFDIAKVDPLRVYVSVPQAYAPNIKVGMKASVTLQEFPGQKFQGLVARTAEAIDMATRTLLTEVDVPNKERRLLPGSFGQVHFSLDSNTNELTIPINAMLFRSEGAQVAVAGSDGKVHLRPVSIGRDYGATLEILDGLNLNEQVIINPSDSLADGQQVQVVTPTQGSAQ